MYREHKDEHTERKRKRQRQQKRKKEMEIKKEGKEDRCTEKYILIRSRTLDYKLEGRRRWTQK